MPATDTIVALSTPPGRSGIGVIRLSGSDAVALTSSLLLDSDFDPQPNRASLKALRDPRNGEILDRAIITYFKSPQSFTGEDVIELSCHGSPPLLLHIIDVLLSLGARVAEPGEFTLRALTNGRLNLAQAEAIRDLIDAQTHAFVRQAARQLGGELSARLQPLKDDLLQIIVPLESSLEFVEDDLPEDLTRDVVRRLSELARQLEQLTATFQTGRLLKEGLRVVLVGRPNVGKSSLFNKLLLYDRAIVTDIPGTTRDNLSEVINIKGVPVALIDTAGVRNSLDRVEQLGIERTRQAIVDADIVVVILDGSLPLSEEDMDVLVETAKNRYLIALNKCDLASLDFPDISFYTGSLPPVRVSAKTGEGLDLLCAAIMELFAVNDVHESSFVITNARHYDLLRRTTDAVRASEILVKERASEEIMLVGLYDALRFLGEITGETTPDDVLSHIFSTFCIGK